jgi:hypothetical protein
VALPWNLPLWWQLRRLRHAIELDCDARVLRRGAEPDLYGEVLLEVTRRSSDVPVGAVAMGEPVSALERRVRGLVPDSARHSLWRACAALLLGAAGIAAAAALEAPQLPAGAPQEAQPQEAQPQGADITERELDLQRTAEFLKQQLVQQAQRLRESEQALQAQAETPRSGAQASELQAQLELLRRALDEARAREQAAREAAARAEPSLAVVVEEDRPTMDLRDLITMAGGKFRRQFIVDPRVRGSVNVDSLAVNSLTYLAFLEVLGVHGFVAVPSGDVVTIIPDAFARTVASPIVNADDIKGDDAEVVTALIPVGENSMQLNPILRQIVPQWGLVQAMPDGKSLLVVARVANVKRIVALVKAQAKVQEKAQ